MQTFNFFLISAAFLLAAYGTLLNSFHWAALGVAVLGVWATYWFNRLDSRTKELIKAGERALAACEQTLVQISGIQELDIIRLVEKPSRGIPTYRVSFTNIEWGIAFVFVVGAVYAALNPK